MSKVYFIPIDSYSKTAKINSAVKALAEKINTAKKVLDFTKQLALKIHTGEDGNITFIEPKNFDSLIDWLTKKSTAKEEPKIYFTETNALYKGKRTIRATHIELAKKHGFTKIPIIIADGEFGEDYSLIDYTKENLKHFKKFKIGKQIAQASQMIVLAHFKGHPIAGFGGAMKQLSMGCAARGGKLDMHAHSKPLINPLQCKKCMTCVKNCPTDSCIIDLIPHINYKTCIGCAKCSAVCPHDAIKINWVSTGQKEFLEKLVEYAYAAQKGKKIIYINFLLNITKDRDCFDTKMKPIAQDTGVLASTDPVAIDSACTDLLKKYHGKMPFGGKYAIEYAEKIGLGLAKYELVNLED
jgi:hypothetical protein